MMSFDVVNSTSYTHTLKQCDFEREQGKVWIHNVQNQGYYKKVIKTTIFFYVFLGNQFL